MAITTANKDLVTQLAATEEPKGELVTGSTYRFPSAPCSFVFSNGVRIMCLEGTYVTDDPFQIKELDAAVATFSIEKL